MGIFDKENIKEMGLLPDFSMGRLWLVENYESYFNRLVTAQELWARNIKVGQHDFKLWNSMDRVFRMIMYRKPVMEMPDYKTIIPKRNAYIKTHKLPSKDTMQEFAEFLDKALNQLKVVYDEEKEQTYIPQHYRGQQH